MKNIIIFLLLINGFLYAQNTRQPTAPTEPERPVVPGASERFEFPSFPSFPGFPNADSQTSGSTQEVERYNLTITGAYQNGDTRRNAANTISGAQYILYSNRAAALKLSFTDGLEYTYHLRNPRARIETSAGVFRETFDVVIQAGNQFLTEQYLGELSYNADTVTSFNLIGSNRVVVLLVFTKKT